MSKIQLAQRKAAFDSKVRRRQKGIDVAVILDCTGSMVRPTIHMNYITLMHGATSNTDEVRVMKLHVIAPYI